MPSVLGNLKAHDVDVYAHEYTPPEIEDVGYQVVKLHATRLLPLFFGRANFWRQACHAGPNRDLADAVVSPHPFP